MTSKIIKQYARHLVWRIKMTKYAYKYLTYDSGIKMLEACNIQFTKASKLNDCMDCCAEKIDYSKLKPRWQSLLVKEIDSLAFSNFGICSLGSSPDNNILWDRYTQTNNIKNGICIELDIIGILNYLIYNVELRICALYVNYVDNVKTYIPRNLLTSKDNLSQLISMEAIIATKNKIDPISGFNWEIEKELRIIYPYKLKEDYFRIQILPSFVKNVWCDIDISQKEFHDLRTLVNTKYKIDVIRRQCNK